MITLTKILVFVLIMCILNVIKEVISFYMAYRTERPFGASALRKAGIMFSLSYILTIIICGI